MLLEESFYSVVQRGVWNINVGEVLCRIFSDVSQPTAVVCVLAVHFPQTPVRLHPVSEYQRFELILTYAVGNFDE